MNHVRNGLSLFVSLVTTSSAWAWLVGALAAVVQFFVPTDLARTFLAFAVGAVLLDTVTGVRAARKRGDLVTSKGWGRIVDKGIGYGAWVAVSAYVNYVVPGASGQILSGVPFLDDFAPMVAGATHVPILVALTLVTNKELISVLENVDQIGVKMPSWFTDRIRKFLNKSQPSE